MSQIKLAVNYKILSSSADKFQMKRKAWMNDAPVQITLRINHILTQLE